MNTRNDRPRSSTMRPQQPAPHPGRMIPASSTIRHLVVRVAGLVPVRTDISHAALAGADHATRRLPSFA